MLVCFLLFHSVFRISCDIVRAFVWMGVVDERMDGDSNGRTYGRMDDRTFGGRKGRMDGRTDGRMDLRYERTGGTDGRAWRTNGRTDRQADG